MGPKRAVSLYFSHKELSREDLSLIRCALPRLCLQKHPYLTPAPAILTLNRAMGIFFGPFFLLRAYEREGKITWGSIQTIPYLYCTSQTWSPHAVSYIPQAADRQNFQKMLRTVSDLRLDWRIRWFRHISRWYLSAMRQQFGWKRCQNQKTWQNMLGL